MAIPSRAAEILKNAKFEDVNGKVYTQEEIMQRGNKPPPGMRTHNPHNTQNTQSVPAPVPPRSTNGLTQNPPSVQPNRTGKIDPKNLPVHEMGGKTAKEIYDEQASKKAKDQTITKQFEALAGGPPPGPVSNYAEVRAAQEKMRKQALQMSGTGDEFDDISSLTDSLTQNLNSSADTSDQAEYQDIVPLRQVQQPPVQPQKAKPKLDSQEDILKEQRKNQPLNVSPILLKARSTIDPKMQRISLPSKCNFYNFDEVFVRPFGIPDMFKVAQVQNSKNLTLLIDLIDNTLSVDARDLSRQDFYYMLYTQRYLSYPRTPFNITWTSKYGNRGNTEVRRSELDIIEATLSKEDFNTQFRSKGFTIPTVRDWELLETENLDEEVRWTYERAQYVIGDTL